MKIKPLCFIMHLANCYVFQIESLIQRGLSIQGFYWTWGEVGVKYKSRFLLPPENVQAEMKVVGINLPGRKMYLTNVDSSVYKQKMFAIRKTLKS